MEHVCPLKEASRLEDLQIKISLLSRISRCFGFIFVLVPNRKSQPVQSAVDVNKSSTKQSFSAIVSCLFMSFIFNIFSDFFQAMLELFSFGKKKIKNKLSIFIKTSNGKSLSVDLDPKWDIKEVKEFVAPQLGMQPEEVKIIFAGKELEDSTTISVS